MDTAAPAVARSRWAWSGTFSSACVPSLGHNVGVTSAACEPSGKARSWPRASGGRQAGRNQASGVRPPPLLETVPLAVVPRLPTAPADRSPPEVQPCAHTWTPAGHDPCRPTCLPLRPAAGSIWPAPPPPAAPSTQAGTWAGGTHHIRPQPLSAAVTDALPVPPRCRPSPGWVPCVWAASRACCPPPRAGSSGAEVWQGVPGQSDQRQHPRGPMEAGLGSYPASRSCVDVQTGNLRLPL